MQVVQQEIDSVKAEIQGFEQEPAAAEQAGDGAIGHRLRREVSSLRAKVNSLREKLTILLRAQASGQYCSLCSELGRIANNCMCTWCDGSVPTLWCPLAMRKHESAGGDKPLFECVGQPFRLPERPLLICAASSLLPQQPSFWHLLSLCSMSEQIQFAFQCLQTPSLVCCLTWILVPIIATGMFFA